MSLDNDYERFAHDIITFVVARAAGKPTDELCKAVAERMLHGPMFTTWPKNVAEANERARAAAAQRAIRRPELPRITPPVLKLPTLPRITPPVLPSVVLPRLK